MALLPATLASGVHIDKRYRNNGFGRLVVAVTYSSQMAYLKECKPIFILFTLNNILKIRNTSHEPMEIKEISYTVKKNEQVMKIYMYSNEALK